MKAPDDPMLTAALRYCAARDARDKARAELRAFREERGGCEYDIDGDRQVPPCYARPASGLDDWCQTCIDSQVIYMRRRKAGAEFSAAARHLMFVYRKGRVAA